MSTQSLKVLFALDRYNNDFGALALALNKYYDIDILSTDKQWAKFCHSNKITFKTLVLPERSFLNRYRLGIFRFIAGFLEHRNYRITARFILRKMRPNLIILPVDHKGFFYYLVKYAQCPTFLPQLTHYSEADLLIGYKEAHFTKSIPIYQLQRQIFKYYKGQWLQYREPFWYSAGKYAAGYRQQYIPKGGNVSVFAVNGEAFKVLYEEFNIPTQKIKVLGSLEQDTLFHLRNHGVKQNRARSSDFSILFFLPPFFGGEPSNEAVFEFKTLLELILKSQNNGVNIGLKPHPLDIKNNLIKKIESFCFNDKIHIVQTRGYESAQGITDLVNKYHICVHSVSSVQYVLQALNKLHVVYLSKHSPYYHSDYTSFYNQYSFFADEPRKFLQLLAMIRDNEHSVQSQMNLKSEEFIKSYMCLDGCVMDRYLLIIKKLMGQGILPAQKISLS